MSLQRLHLQNCALCTTFLVVLFQFLSSSTCIEILRLDNNCFSNDAIDAAHLFLTRNKTLIHLGIGRCHIDDERLTVLSEALMTNATLTFLDLGYNGITDRGIKALCERLKYNQNVKELNLSRNEVRRLDYFEVLFGTNKTLEKLTLGYDMKDFEKVFNLQQKHLERRILFDLYFNN